MKKRLKQSNRMIGSRYEKLAAAYLIEKGYHILEYNYRYSSGEIDLIGRQGEYLVFIEVKYRKTATCGDPAEAVTRKKQQRILRTAECYLLTHGYGENTPCRFDVVTILGQEIRMIQNAFWA